MYVNLTGGGEIIDNAVYEDWRIFKKIRCNRRRDARIVWLNPNAAQIFSEFGIDLPVKGEFQNLILEKFALSTDEGGHVTAYADYYGSTAIDSAVGSGRAATVEGVQIKGIGCTGLVAPGADWLHSHGLMSVEEALREAYFSKVAEDEFPGGAIPTIAVLELDEMFNDIGGAKLKRGLLLRPFVIRLCHLERAFSLGKGARPYFKSHHLEDIDRVVAWSSISGMTTRERIGRSAEMVGRQLAHAHIFHWFNGGFFPSNFSIDGRLIDFGSSRRVHSWRRMNFQTFGPVFGSELESMTKAFALMVLGVDYYLKRDLDARNADAVMRGGYKAQISYEYKHIAEMLNAGQGSATRCSLDVYDNFEFFFKKAQHASTTSLALSLEKEFTMKMFSIEGLWERYRYEDREFLQDFLNSCLEDAWCNERFADWLATRHQVFHWWKSNVSLS